MKQYINAPGSELLFVYLKGKNSLYARMLCLWSLDVLMALPVMVAYAAWLHVSLWYDVLIFVDMALIIGFIYGLSMLCANTFLPLMLSVLYLGACVVFAGFPSIFVQGPDYSLFGNVIHFIVLIVLAALFIWVGLYREKRYMKKG
nr:hypothetical protein [bacterium]